MFPRRWEAQCSSLWLLLICTSTRQRDCTPCKASPCSCVLGLLRRTLAMFSITPSPSLFHSTFLAVSLRTQAPKPANGEMEGGGSDISNWGRVLSLTPQSHATPPPPVDLVKTKWFLPGNRCLCWSRASFVFFQSRCFPVHAWNCLILDPRLPTFA